MPTLFDTIQQNAGQVAGQQAPQQDQTQQIQQLLRAKSGKAALPGSDANISNLGEQSAISQANQQKQNQITPEATAQNTQLQTQQQAQSQQAQAQGAQIAGQRSFDNLQTRLKTNEIMQNLSNNAAQLSNEDKNAQMEQAAFYLSMQNKSYVSNLQKYSAENRLDDKNQFQQQMQQTAFGDNLGVLQQKLGNDNLMSVNDQQFKQALGSLTIDDANKIADLDAAHNAQMDQIKEGAMIAGGQYQADAANLQNKYKGYSQLLSGGIGAAGAYGQMKGNQPPSGQQAGSGSDTGNIS